MATHSTATAHRTRIILGADASTSALAALIHLVAPEFLARHLHLPSTLVTWSGVAMLGFAAYVSFLLLPGRLSRSRLLILVLANAAWSIACLWLLLNASPTQAALGKGYVLLQAGWPAGLVVLQALAWLDWRDPDSDR